MKYITSKELILSLILLILGILLLNPFDMSMSHVLRMTVYGLLLIFTGIFTGLVVHEKAHDERELDHYNRAGRFGYTLGIIVLLAGITWQTVYMPYDPWLLATLIAMIIGKVGSRIYSRMYR
jgi:amino acid transporter